MNAERRANEFALLSIRLEELRIEAVRGELGPEIIIPIANLRAGANRLARQFAELARTGPDCTVDGRPQ